MFSPDKPQQEKKDNNTVESTENAPLQRQSQTVNVPYRRLEAKVEGQVGEKNLNVSPQAGQPLSIDTSMTQESGLGSQGVGSSLNSNVVSNMSDAVTEITGLRHGANGFSPAVSRIS